MATVTRQPFAPLDGVRLQNLTSLKNRQNALSPPSAGKRKATEAAELDDFENVDPGLFSKRSKGTDGFPSKDFFKPSSFSLTKSTSAPSLIKNAQLSVTSPVKAAAPASRHRSLLQPKSPAAKLNAASIARSSPLSAPAGRSPTRASKRIGILSNWRRTASPFTRVDPPSFSLGSAAPFSLDAALKGTIPSYATRSAAAALAPPLASSSYASSARSLGLDGADGAEMKSSWFFDIHEDTPEQEMTNLLQHSTCVLDISSDEESEQKARRERAEGRDKENIPPVDDVSQTSSMRSAAASDDMIVEKARYPLGQLNAADFYPEGCDGASIIIIPGDEEVGGAEAAAEAVASVPVIVAPDAMAPEAEDVAAAVDVATAPLPDEDINNMFEAAPQPSLDVEAALADELMTQRDEPAAKAAVLEPIEGTGESFELWESGSARDEADPARSPSPAPVADAGMFPSQGFMAPEAVAGC